MYIRSYIGMLLHCYIENTLQWNCALLHHSIIHLESLLVLTPTVSTSSISDKWNTRSVV